MGTLDAVFGNARGPFAFRGEEKDGRWWNGDVLAGEGVNASLVGRVSNGIANFLLEVPPWVEAEWPEPDIRPCARKIGYPGTGIPDGRRLRSRLNG